MRTILKIIAAPFVLALILIVAVLTFLSCVAGAVCIVACVGLSLLAILCLLAGHPNRVYSTDEIFEQVWKEQVYEVNNTVMVHIRRLREKIEDDPKNPSLIKTVWGVGYKIEA